MLFRSSLPSVAWKTDVATADQVYVTAHYWDFACRFRHLDYTIRVYWHDPWLPFGTKAWVIAPDTVLFPVLKHGRIVTVITDLKHHTGSLNEFLHVSDVWDEVTERFIRPHLKTQQIQGMYWGVPLSRKRVESQSWGWDWRRTYPLTSVIAPTTADLLQIIGQTPLTAGGEELYVYW